MRSRRPQPPGEFKGENSGATLDDVSRTDATNPSPPASPVVSEHKPDHPVTHFPDHERRALSALVVR
jgi:hypothetical protein